MPGTEKSLERPNPPESLVAANPPPQLRMVPLLRPRSPHGSLEDLSRHAMELELSL